MAEAYDIVLGKLARLEPKDFDDILSLRERAIIDAETLLKRLNEHHKELRNNPSYRQNAILLFEAVFGQPVRFRAGRAELLLPRSSP